jgi:hypothetical protein
MVAFLGKVLRSIRLHAVLSSTIAFVSLRNAIQCGRSWQPGRRCGPAIPVSVVEAFARVMSRAKCGNSLLSGSVLPCDLLRAFLRLLYSKHLVYIFVCIPVPLCKIELESIKGQAKCFLVDTSYIL